MTTATLHREIKELKQRQTRLERKVAEFLKEQDLPYGDWELKPSALKRIELAHKQISAGKGVTFNSAGEIRKYFRSKRHAR